MQEQYHTACNTAWELPLRIWAMGWDFAATKIHLAAEMIHLCVKNLLAAWEASRNGAISGCFLLHPMDAALLDVSISTRQAEQTQSA